VANFANKPWFMTTAVSTITTFRNLAYALAVLYFLIELIGQIIALDKVTPEIIVRMLIKLFIAKILIDAAPEICKGIYQTFQGLVTVTSAPGDRIITTNPSFTGMFTGLDKIGLDIIFGAANRITVARTLSAMFLIVQGVAVAIAVGSRSVTSFLLPIGIVLALPLITLLIVTFMLVGQYITLYVRYIEIGLLTILSPLAMAGAASGEFKGVTKKFLLSFAAVCLQGTIIIVGAAIICALSEDPVANLAGFNPLTGMGEAILTPIAIIMRCSMFTMLIGKSRSFANAVLQG